MIVSAQYGATDELLAEARGDRAGARTTHALDLLWSTGELRSVARLTLHLQRIGVSAIPFNVHQTGLVACPSQSRAIASRARRCGRCACWRRSAASRIVIVPGFLGVSAGGTITSLGRGGSDLTAVLLATAVRADACELIKDVPGYFTADPHRDAQARQIHDLPIDDALRMADARLRSRPARGAGRGRAGRPASGHPQHGRCGTGYTRTSPSSRKDRSTHHGVRHQDDSRRAAVGA